MRHGKKWTVVQILILSVLALLLVLTMLLPQLQQLRTAPAPLEISVLIRDNDSTLWANARLGMEQAAYDMGAELRFLTPVQKNSAAEQYGLLLREAEGGSNAIVLAPADSIGFEAWCASHDIAAPVITLESPQEGAAVLPDNAALGEALAQACLQDVSPAPTVLLLDASPQSGGVAQRISSAQQALAAAGANAVLVPVPDALEAGWLAELVLQHSPAAILALEPDATQKAAEELEEMPAPPPLYGVGSASRITAWMERGVIAAVAVWNEYTEGYLAVQNAVLSAQNKPAQTSVLEIFIIKRGDIYEPENQKLLFPVTN